MNIPECVRFCVCGFIGEFALATRGLDRWLLTGDKACTHLVRVYTSQFCQSACGETDTSNASCLTPGITRTASIVSQPALKTNNKNQRSATNHLHKIPDTLPNVVLSPRAAIQRKGRCMLEKESSKTTPHKQTTAQLRAITSRQLANRPYPCLTRCTRFFTAPCFGENIQP